LLGPRPPSFLGGLYHAAFIKHHEGTSFGDFHLAGKHLLDWSPAELDAYLARYNVGWVVCWSPVARFVFDRYLPAQRIGTLPRWHTRGLVVPAAEDQWRRLSAVAGPDVAMQYVREGATQYALYRLDRPTSFALDGRARLASADFNRWTLEDLEPGPDGSVVLSLHWLDTWRTEPPLPLERVPTPGDPVGFVRIRLPGPIPRLELYNGYRSRRP
jgi:hypothetical protein